MKKYQEIFEASLEEQYQTGNYPLMALSANNLMTKKIKFVPIGQYDDGTNPVVEYAIQRFKRTKEGNQQNAHVAAAGSDYVATLDQATDIDWETITTQRSAQKQLLISVKKGEGTNALANATAYEATISKRAENKLISKEERAVETILTSIDAQGADHTIDITATLTAATTKAEKREVLADAFVDVADNLAERVDDFKYNSQPVALYYPRIGKGFAKLEGQGYTQGTNTFGEDFKQGFNYAGLDFLPEDVFKSIERIGGAGDDTDRLVIGIVMAEDSYQDSGLEQGNIEVNESLIRRDVIGHIYDDLNVIVDKARQFKIVATIASLKAAGLLGAGFAKQAKVND